MRSRLAEDLRRDQLRQALEMTPEERVAAALAMGEQAVLDYMENFGVDRAEAVRVFRRAGQAGRHYSACMDDSLHERSDPSDR
jgi:hypothetical protein